MLVNLRIRLTAHILGDKKMRQQKRDPNEEEPPMLRVFSTVEEDEHPLDLVDLYESLRAAISDLGLLHISAEMIHFPTHIQKPKYIRYVRHYQPRNSGRKLEEIFVGIQKNNVLTIPVFIYDDDSSEPGALKPPTLEEFEKIMIYVGKHIGISPFGKNFGYGRFTIHALINSSNAIPSNSERQPAADNPIVPGDREGADLHPQEHRQEGVENTGQAEAEKDVHQEGS